ncbi:MAG: PIN domain-containing protein [Verrucomicrobia bacterium]|nr:PIN domain-containing protein [Verrucomicrobiota bacterium]
MTFGLDTDCVLRILLGTPEIQAEKILEFIRKTREDSDKIVISDLVVAETYFALRHHYKISQKEAILRIRQMLDSGLISCVGVAHEILAQAKLDSAGPGLIDRLIHLDYLRRDADHWVTSGKAGKRLPHARVL